MPSQPWAPDRPDAIDLMREAEVEEAALLAAGSNYVYLCTLHHPTGGTGYAVYKPQRGEAPLNDCPDGTLYKREYAAYLVAEAIGWHIIPPSLVRSEGMPYGVGVMQLFIEHDPSQHYFNLKEGRVEEMKRIALFDWVTNNADRKGGHTLLAMCLRRTPRGGPRPALRAAAVHDRRGARAPPVPRRRRRPSARVPAATAVPPVSLAHDLRSLNPDATNCRFVWRPS
jgi:hypothetical protein